ncbi:type II toxin-antitoxin system PemK/MazF family toxin [Lentibacillus sp. N15]|uniref:type II toxin-antitoxin system PemK/MazF family toxin n=1 Tax=Lentibacillus songyuanensis TaxID=3136161 RepID=UPI0031BB11D0
MKIPKRGDLVYLNFSPQIGHEQAGHRPAIVLSPKKFNEAQKFAIVCPITSRKKGYPFEIGLPDDLLISGVILSDQVRSLDWRARNLKIKDKAPVEIINKCIKRIHKILYVSDYARDN